MRGLYRMADSSPIRPGQYVLAVPQVRPGRVRVEWHGAYGLGWLLIPSELLRKHGTSVRVARSGAVTDRGGL